MELWLPVIGYEGLYMVSSLGRVKSCARISFGCNKSVRERILKPSFELYGYPKVVLSKNKKLKTHKIHRLVATAFIPNTQDKPQVNHIDCNPNNNSINNLEWCNNKENFEHSVKMGRAVKKGNYKVDYPNNNGLPKKVYQYSTSWQLIKEWNSISDIVRAGVVKRTESITRCCTGVINVCKGYIWRFGKIN